MPDTHPPALTSDRDERYGAALSGEQLQAMLARVTARTVDRAPTPRDRLRELPTTARVGLSYALLVAVGVMFVVAMGVRGDLATADWVRHGAAMVAMLVVSCVAVAVSLRGLHARPLGVVGSAVGLLALTLPVVAAVMPGLWTGASIPGEAGMTPHVMCFAGGGAVAVLTAVPVLVFSRSTSPVVHRLLAATGAGGIAGFVALQVQCAAGDRLHLLLSHGTLGVAMAAVALVAVLGLRTLRG